MVRPIPPEEARAPAGRCGLGGRRAQRAGRRAVRGVFFGGPAGGLVFSSGARASRPSSTSGRLALSFLRAFVSLLFPFPPSFLRTPSWSVAPGSARGRRRGARRRI